MKRFLITLCICLLLGAAINVAMAWGISCGIIRLSTSGRNSERTPDATDIAIWRDAASVSANEPTYCSAFDTVGLRARTLIDVDPLDSSSLGHMCVWTQAGWPFLSMEGGVFHDMKKQQIEWQGLYWRESSPIGLLNVPLRPVWGGFVINTVLYAALLWLFVVSMLALRRRRRIKRGLCINCKYPVGTSAVCTECGAAVQPRRLRIPGPPCR